MKTNRKSERGMGMVEYALVVVLVAVVLIVVMALVGPAIERVFNQVSCGMYPVLDEAARAVCDAAKNY